MPTYAVVRLRAQRRWARVKAPRTPLPKPHMEPILKKLSSRIARTHDRRLESAAKDSRWAGDGCIHLHLPNISPQARAGVDLGENGSLIPRPKGKGLTTETKPTPDGAMRIHHTIQPSSLALSLAAIHAR